MTTGSEHKMSLLQNYKWKRDYHAELWPLEKWEISIHSLASFLANVEAFATFQAKNIKFNQENVLFKQAANNSRK